jgi:hypothetical protein
VASATAVDNYSLDKLTINKLSDDVLLCIFVSYRRISEKRDGTWPWHKLAHICGRWRNLVFGRAGHLNLQLACKSKTDVNTALDIWPALPIVIDADFGRSAGCDIVGTLEARDRIVGISLWKLDQYRLSHCLRVMQQPFPVLTSFDLNTKHGAVAHVNTNVLFGGSIPRLKRLSLSGIKFSTLPTLLSSACGLVDLHVEHFAVIGREDISPEAMTTCLSSLTRLRSLFISFEWYPSLTYPTTQHPPPFLLAPTVLPALTDLSLGGSHEYLENLLSRIDTPLLEQGQLSFHNVPNF